MSGPPFWFYGSYYPPQGYPPPGQPSHRNEAPFAPPAMAGAGYYPRGHPPPQSQPPPYRSDPPFAPPGISRPHQDPIRQQRERPSRHRRRKSELERIMEAERKQQEQEQAQAQAARVRRWLQDVGEQTSLEEDGVSRPESRKANPLFAIKKEYHEKSEGMSFKQSKADEIENDRRAQERAEAMRQKRERDMPAMDPETYEQPRGRRLYRD